MATILNIILRVSTASLFIATVSAADKFHVLLDHLSNGVSIDRVAELENAKASGLAGSASSIMKHSYMAIKPYIVDPRNGSAGITGVRETFVKRLIAALVEDMKKMGFDINYSHDWPFKDGMSDGHIRLKTKKGDDPALAAMIDVRLFGTSNVSFHVTVAYHIMYLDDPEMIPNLLPHVVPPGCRSASESLSETPVNEKTGPEGVPSAPRQSKETGTPVEGK